MTSFVGVVSDAGGKPLGKIKISLSGGNDLARVVTGSVVAGSNPRGLTGFAGDWSPDGSFSAHGQNRLINNPKNPFDDVLLVVDLAGRRSGTTVVGTILADVNPEGGGSAKEWTFEAYDIQADPRAAELVARDDTAHAQRITGPITAAAAGGRAVMRGAGGVVSVLAGLPTPVKLLGGAAVAAVVGKKLIDR